MRLVPHRYPIVVKYKPGKEFFFADALSRFLSPVLLHDETEQFEVNVVESLSVSDKRLKAILEATGTDSAMVQLRQYASTSWPVSKHDVAEEIRSYWNYRDDLHAEVGLLLRNRLVIPKVMRREVLNRLHAAHCGAEKIKHRARGVMCWPNMASDIEVLAKTCQVCEKHKHQNERLAMFNHDIPFLSWQVVGADLFYHEGREFLILVDFYSFSR